MKIPAGSQGIPRGNLFHSSEFQKTKVFCWNSLAHNVSQTVLDSHKFVYTSQFGEMPTYIRDSISQSFHSTLLF